MADYVFGSPASSACAARAREAITTMTTAKTLTAATYESRATAVGAFDGATSPVGAVLNVKTAAVNFTVDGTAPTATAGTDVGFYGNTGDTITLWGRSQVANFKAINAVNANGAILEVAYLY